MKIRKTIIPAAGLGTLFLPATKAQPMDILAIVDKPTIQYIVVIEYLKDFYEKAQGESLKREGT